MHILHHFILRDLRGSWNHSPTDTRNDCVPHLPLHAPVTQELVSFICCFFRSPRADVTHLRLCREKVCRHDLNSGLSVQSSSSSPLGLTARDGRRGGRSGLLELGPPRQRALGSCPDCHLGLWSSSAEPHWWLQAHTPSQAPWCLPIEKAMGQCKSCLPTPSMDPQIPE